MIDRQLENKILQTFFKGKIIHIPGARQVGKTTLIQKIANQHDKVLFMNGDNPDIRSLFASASSTKLSALMGDHKLIILDEAQRIPDIGITLKMMIDQHKDKQIIATGSSAFELANQINEPLTGRKYEYQLFPFSTRELIDHYGMLEESRMLEQRLIYGYYPDVVTNPGQEKDILQNLSDAYLYKDIFIYESLRKPALLEKILRALAFQVGNEVSLNEIGQLVGSDSKTVERYIDLLEKAYIIFSLSSLSRNARNEIKRGRKVYFYDNGIRNAVVRNFNSLELRPDVGALWENYCVSERFKYTSYQRIWSNRFFWRTHAQQEIDYIEEYDGVLHAYEFKWNTRKKSKLPKAFADHYPEHEFKVITPDNYLEFIS
jgi:predicted AAA+ superfamily ATPase